MAPDSEKSRAERVQAALLAAEERRPRAEIMSLLDGVSLTHGVAAPLDEAFLTGELAYSQGRYKQAVEAFKALDARREVPPWQAYASAHRRAFASLQLGLIGDATEATEAAADLLRKHPALRQHEADLDAMRGHVSELRGDFETAWALFEIAYTSAHRHRNFHRERSTASDLGRIAAIVGRPSEGLEWLRRAREVTGDEVDARALRTLELREGILEAMLGRTLQAKATFTAVIDGGAEDETAVDALGRRADLSRMLGHVSPANSDLRRALRVAETHGLVRHALYCHKDLAALLLDMGESALAADEFEQAIQLALGLVPPQPLVLMQLAQDILVSPGLVGQPLKTLKRQEIERIVRELGELSRESAYQRGTREKARSLAVRNAIGVLGHFVDETVELEGCTVRMVTGRVTPRIGMGRLRQGELTTLRALLAAPSGMTIRELADKTQREDGAVSKSVSRLREELAPGSLVTLLRARLPAIHRAARSNKQGVGGKKGP